MQIREVPADYPDFLSMQRDPVWDYQRCLVIYSGSRPRGCLTYHFDDQLFGIPEGAGVVGHYEAADGPAGVALLKEATARLKAEGASQVLGPINGNIWCRFRLAHENAEKPFFLEPVNPSRYHQDFLSAGFVEDSIYQSSIVEGLEAVSEASPELAEGFTEVFFDPSRAEWEMQRLYQLSVRSFAENLYHRKIDFESFRAMHLPFIEQLDPDLFLIVEDGDGEAAAFLLAYPDFLDPGGKRAVAKTLGVLPEWRRKKLGRYLLARVHQIASRKGYLSVIHALMSVDNPSSVLSQTQLDGRGRLFRSYSLYRWENLSCL